MASLQALAVINVIWNPLPLNSLPVCSIYVAALNDNHVLVWNCHSLFICTVFAANFGSFVDCIPLDPDEWANGRDVGVLCGRHAQFMFKVGSHKCDRPECTSISVHILHCHTGMHFKYIHISFLVMVTGRFKGFGNWFWEMTVKYPAKTFNFLNY